MQANLSNRRVTPLAASKRLNPTRPAPDDASFWADQMERVAVHGDTECFMRVYDHYAPRVHRYFLGLSVAHAQADELVQEAMLRAWRHAARFDSQRAALSTWLFSIARNLYLDSVRYQSHRRTFEDDAAPEQVEFAADAAAGPEAFTDHAGLARAIGELPADQARLIRMSYLESKSHSEIAEELGMPLGTVKSTLRRSFEKLRIALRPTA